MVELTPAASMLLKFVNTARSACLMLFNAPCKDFVVFTKIISIGKFIAF